MSRRPRGAQSPGPKAKGPLPIAHCSIGIIGGGRIAERHVQAYKHLGGVNLTLTDADRTVTEKRGAAWEIETEPDPGTLLSRPDIDAIDVCAPTMFHAGYAVAALEAGKHVFCEKPLCTNMAEAERIRRAAAQSGKVAMTGYLYRFYPAFEFVRDILDQQVIGKPYMAIIRVGGRGGTAAWKHQSAESGGAVSEMMVHMFDLAAWYFGKIEDLHVLWHTTLLPERNVAGQTIQVTAEDFSVVRLRAGDVQILLQSDLATPSYMQHIDIQGDNGSIFSSILHYLPTVVYCKEQRGIYDQGNNLYTFPQVNVFERELQHFLAIIGGAEPARDYLEDSIHIVELTEQIK